MYHNPVLLQASLEGLQLKPDGVYVDCTFGGGGHSKAILEQLGENGKLFAFDQDPDAWQNELTHDARFTLIKLNFRHLSRGLRMHKQQKVDGILADLGVSSHQFDTADRGFSLRFDGPLDMRMNPTIGISAADWLAQADEASLIRVLREYGEVPNARRLAQAILARQQLQPFQRTLELATFLEAFAPKQKWHAYKAQVFQALRIEVNGELDALRELLQASLDVLHLEGRMVIISYHSLEDRMVKHFMREGWLDDDAERDEKGRRHFRLRAVHRKPIAADDAEIEGNSRARSARLRTAERVEAWI